MHVNPTALRRVTLAFSSFGSINFAFKYGFIRRRSLPPTTILSTETVSPLKVDILVESTSLISQVSQQAKRGLSYDFSIIELLRLYSRPYFCLTNFSSMLSLVPAKLFFLVDRFFNPSFIALGVCFPTRGLLRMFPSIIRVVLISRALVAAFP